MKTFFRSLKRQDGFTLVELMVVVAIIGLLSAVAVPNFKKYQAKAKMSEAKLQLSSLYTAESSFFSDFNVFATCLNYMGYNPSGEQASRYYAVGFNVAAAINQTAWNSAMNSGLMDGTGVGQCSRTLGAGQLTDAGGISFFVAGKGTGAAIANAATFSCNTMIGTQEKSTDNADTDNDGMTFRASAAGVIDANFSTDATSSCITIDNRKRVVVRRNGF